MTGFSSATEYVRAQGLAVAGVEYEIGHAMGHGQGGKQTQSASNLAAISQGANSQMMAADDAISGNSAIIVDTSFHLHPSTYVAQFIHQRFYHADDPARPIYDLWIDAHRPRMTRSEWDIGQEGGSDFSARLSAAETIVSAYQHLAGFVAPSAAAAAAAAASSSTASSSSASSSAPRSSGALGPSAPGAGGLDPAGQNLVGIFAEAETAMDTAEAAAAAGSSILASMRPPAEARPSIQLSHAPEADPPKQEYMIVHSAGRRMTDRAQQAQEQRRQETWREIQQLRLEHDELAIMDARLVQQIGGSASDDPDLPTAREQRKELHGRIGTIGQRIAFLEYQL
jgi:hypothetical protein